MYQYIKPIFSRYIKHFKIALPKRVVMSQTIRYSTLYCTIRGGKRQPNIYVILMTIFEENQHHRILETWKMGLTHLYIHVMIHIVVYTFR